MNTSAIIRDELSNLLYQTRQTALSDGLISQDESRLIDLLSQQLDHINDEIQEITDLMAHLSEAQIRDRVKIVSREIVPKLAELAKEDNHISEDEAAILDTITRLIVDN